MAGGTQCTAGASKMSTLGSGGAKRPAWPLRRRYVTCCSSDRQDSPRTLSLFYMENTSVHRKVCRRIAQPCYIALKLNSGQRASSWFFFRLPPNYNTSKTKRNTGSYSAHVVHLRKMPGGAQPLTRCGCPCLLREHSYARDWQGVA